MWNIYMDEHNGNKYLTLLHNDIGKDALKGMENHDFAIITVDKVIIWLFFSWSSKQNAENWHKGKVWKNVKKKKFNVVMEKIHKRP